MPEKLSSFQQLLIYLQFVRDNNLKIMLSCIRICEK